MCEERLSDSCKVALLLQHSQMWMKWLSIFIANDLKTILRYSCEQEPRNFRGITHSCRYGDDLKRMIYSPADAMKQDAKLQTALVVVKEMRFVNHYRANI